VTDERADRLFGGARRHGSSYQGWRGTTLGPAGGRQPPEAARRMPETKGRSVSLVGEPYARRRAFRKTANTPTPIRAKVVGSGTGFTSQYPCIGWAGVAISSDAESAAA
jgi:hypothetical protein